MSRLLVILAALSISVASGQTPKPATQAKPGVKPAAPANRPFTPPKTPWGDPDLQGVWNDATSTPLQRPNGKDKDILSDEEAADWLRNRAGTQFDPQVIEACTRIRSLHAVRSTYVARSNERSTGIVAASI